MKRDHLKKLIPLINLAIEKSGQDLKAIDAIAYTAGPGLRGPLLIGASTAKAISMSLNKPCIGIHHMEAHLLINLLENPAPSFPFLTLLISGGHCLLINAKAIGDYEILGQTLDDAVGEAFDKVAKILDLGYPGGPKIESLAKEGNPKSFNFPRPMTNKKNFDFSFSGLKTAVYYEFKKIHEIDGVAATAGPGLVVCLNIGFNIGKSLAVFGKKPFIPINHLYLYLFIFITFDLHPFLFKYLNITLSLY